MKSMKSRPRPAGGGGGGGIRKRGPTRTDRDGDMEMDASSGRGGKKSRGGPGPVRPAARQPGGRTQGRSKNLDAIQRALVDNAGTSQANVRSGAGRGNSSLEQFIITGWAKSKASTNRDRGVENLVSFLERRMNAQQKGPKVKITKSRVDGDALIVFLRPELGERIRRLNGALFAGIYITVEDLNSSPHAALDHELSNNNGTSASTADTKSKMATVLGKRYYPDTKLLDLSKLGTDPDLQAMGIFNSTSTESKFFPALMKVWEMQFPNAAERRAAVESVSLAHNQLTSIAAVTTLAQTFPHLKNLDLSHNNLKDDRSVSAWRWKFRDLQFLDMTENPFSSDPRFKETILKWYPNLQTLNNVQVRTAEEIAAQKKAPIPNQPPFFEDQGNIGEHFIRAFFPSYDNDRNELIDGVYDARSTFTLNVNTSAPRSSQVETASWEPYLKSSRNLLKINHLPARMSRNYVGVEKIRQFWNNLPPTRHPDLNTQADEYLVECFPIPHLPDPTGQNPGGVGGLQIMVHGKFEESVNGKVELRSFDRTFVLGPGNGAGGITVINDILCLRAYGGHEAWSPENQSIPQALLPPTAGPAAVPAAAPVAIPAAPAAPAAPVAQPTVPEGYGAPAPGKADTQVQQEQMVIQMSTKSGMTLQFSEMALSSNGWNLEAAWNNFEQLKAQGTLPADAFLS